MPISIEEFESTPATEGRPATAGERNAERVLAFLSERPTRAFTPAEIRAATGVPRGSVCVVLSRLEDQRLRHRGHYWAAAAGRTAEKRTE